MKKYSEFKNEAKELALIDYKKIFQIFENQFPLEEKEISNMTELTETEKQWVNDNLYIFEFDEVDDVEKIVDFSSRGKQFTELDLDNKQIVKKITENRQYLDVINSNAALRNKILKFIGEKGSVPFTEMKEFFASIQEEVGKQPSRSYLAMNKHLIDRRVTDEGTSEYFLTKKGKKILELIQDDAI